MFLLKWKYLLVALLLFLIEVGIALFVHDSFIRPIGGDFLVVILIYCFLRGIINWSAQAIAVATLLFAYAVEIAQYFKLVELLGLADNRLARIVIGTSFSWGDMLAYTLGVLLVYWINVYGVKNESSDG